jgi:uncharacterized protein with ATP-grasp and redox domains
MKAHPDCIPCVFAQVLRAARRVTADEAELFAVLSQAMALLHGRIDSRTPADLSSVALRAVHEHFGVDDLYAPERARTNAMMLTLEPELRRAIADSADPIRTALKIAAAANTIDFGITDDVDVQAGLDKAMEAEFAIDDTGRLIDDLARSRKLLYLVDNSGEIVADKLAIETFGHPEVWAGVKGGPALNDATMADAEAVGLESVAHLISNGSAKLGTVLDDCSPEFRRCFDEADLIIAKGQANYESLDDADANVYFIMTAKCRLVARQLGVQLGDVVVVHGGRSGGDR